MSDLIPLNGHAAGPFDPRRQKGDKLALMMEVVCAQMDISVAALRGTTQPVRLVRARAIVAQLCLEFCPRYSAYAVDEAMLRGSGWCIWSRSRHLDRCEQFPSYAMTFERCRQAALAAFKPKLGDGTYSTISRTA